MQTLLIAVGIAVLVLLMLYLFSYRFPRFGDGLAFLCTLVVRMLVLLEWAVRKAANRCDTAFQKSLRYPPGVTDDLWFGLYVFVRLVNLFLGACVLLGETGNTLAALPVLFQIPNDVTLPGGVSLASGMLFLAVPALYGGLALESYELVPLGARLFPQCTGSTKKVMGVSSIIGFLLSVVVLVLFWVYRAWFLLDPDNAQLLSPFLLGGLGLCVAGASVLALWACIIGLVGLFSVCAWCISFLLTGIAVALSLLPGLFDVLAIHLSSGTMTVYQDFEKPGPYRVSPIQFSAASPEALSEATEI